MPNASFCVGADLGRIGGGVLYCMWCHWVVSCGVTVVYYTVYCAVYCVYCAALCDVLYCVVLTVYCTVLHCVL